MAVRLNLFSNTEQDTKKVSTVEELPQYMLKCIYDNNVAEESEEAKQEKMAKIKRKLEAGKKLTKEELSWLQRNDPIAYAHAIRVQMIAEEVEKELKAAKSKEVAEKAIGSAETEANRIVSTAVSGISDDDPDKEYIVAAVNRVSDEFHKSGAYSRLPGTQESAEKRKQKKKNGISFKREDEKEELMNWSPLQEVVEKLPTFTAGA